MGYIWLLICAALHTVHATNYPVHVGNETVIVQKLHRHHGKSFVHLHQNETTALKAAKIVVAAKGGSILTLIHSGKRNIVFHLKHKRYEFDPNRIFSDVGIKKTLTEFGGYTREAHHEVKKLANKIKRLLPKGKIIAVHNNNTYSLKYYLPGHELAADAKAVNFYDPSHYRNFYLVTKTIDFLRLKKLKFNGVLQARHSTNDGSLSVYLAKRKYINVEAGYCQLSAQVKMLKYA